MEGAHCCSKSGEHRHPHLCSNREVDFRVYANTFLLRFKSHFSYVMVTRLGTKTFSTRTMSLGFSIISRQA